MKNVILTLSLVLFCLFSYAQKQPRMFMWNSADLKEINASEAQISQLNKITKESRDRIKVIEADASLSDADKKAKIRDEYKVRSAARRKVVTPEQLEIVNKITKERKAAN